jgi:hypothetical protein
MTQQTTPPNRWKQLAIAALALCLILIGIIAFILDAARLSLSDHHNLYYTLWKHGLRDYDWTVTDGRMLHDHEFRESLHGLTLEEFENRFPNTFHKMQTPPPDAQAGRSYYTDNYFASQPNGHQHGFGWVVVFENGRLLEFGYEKGA